MKLDRTKHNKFVTGAVYGNTTSGSITPSSSTTPVVGGGGSTVIIQGGNSDALTEVSMGMLINVGSWADEVATEDRFLVQTAESNQWVAKPISDIIGTGEGSAYNKLDNSYFDKLFVAIDENGNEIDPNDSVTKIASIKARYGFWTEHFISVKGNNGDGENDTPYSRLSELQDIRLSQPVYNGQILVYRNGYWVNENASFGGTVDEEMLSAYAKLSYVDSKIKEVKQQIDAKVDKTYFARIFNIIGENGEDVDVNDMDTVIASIKANYGLWTEEYLSALGYNPAEGEVPTGGIDKDELLDILEEEGYAKLEDIPAVPDVPTKVSELENDAGYINAQQAVNIVDNRLDERFKVLWDAEMAKWFAIDETTGAIYPVDDRGFFSNSFISALGPNGQPGTGGGNSGSVTLEEDILVTTNVGYYSSGNVIKQGTSWEDIFRKMLYKPTPAALSGKISTSTDLEYGSTKGTLTYTATRNDNGPMTAAYYDGNTANTLTFSEESATGVQTATRKLSGQYTARETYKATVVYSANEETEVAETTLTSTISVNVYRKWFAGVIDTIPTTSAEIRNLNSNGLYKGAGTYSFNIGKWTKFVICIPSDSLTSLTLTAYPGNFVEDTSVCKLYGTIMVEGANGSTAAEYKMYLIQAETENDADKFTFKTN